MALGWQIAIVAGWVLTLALGFLLLGALRRIEWLNWRIQHLQGTEPRRIGRDGLPPGRKAPNFELPSVAGGNVSLADFLGRRILLLFAQEGCSPCHGLLPVLQAANSDRLQALVVYNGQLETAQEWAREAGVNFPILIQEKLAISKRYEMLATPFAFVINEQGIVAGKGVINTSQHLEFLLDEARQWDRKASEDEEHASTTRAEVEPAAEVSEEKEAPEPVSSSAT